MVKSQLLVGLAAGLTYANGFTFGSTYTTNPNVITNYIQSSSSDPFKCISGNDNCIYTGACPNKRKAIFHSNIFGGEQYALSLYTTGDGPENLELVSYVGYAYESSYPDADIFNWSQDLVATTYDKWAICVITESDGDGAVVLRRFSDANCNTVAETITVATTDQSSTDVDTVGPYRLEINANGDEHAYFVDANGVTIETFPF